MAEGMDSSRGDGQWPRGWTVAEGMESGRGDGEWLRGWIMSHVMDVISRETDRLHSK